MKLHKKPSRFFTFKEEINLKMFFLCLNNVLRTAKVWMLLKVCDEKVQRFLSEKNSLEKYLGGFLIMSFSIIPREMS